MEWLPKFKALNDLAIFIVAVWIVFALVFAPIFGMHWLTPGDFDYRTITWYHGIMIPLTGLLFLMTVRVSGIKRLASPVFSLATIIAVLAVGMGSISKTGKGMSIASLVQILGMITIDILGIILVLALIAYSRKQRKPAGPAFFLLFLSLAGILIAAPLGHLAGWGADFGINSLPGMSGILHALNMRPKAFQEGLVSSHSHLIATCEVFAWVALTAIAFDYQSLTGRKRHFTTMGLVMAGTGVIFATGIYVAGVFGWEPPTVFASGPNGMPLDDLVLTFGQSGIIFIIAGLLPASIQKARRNPDAVSLISRITIFSTWVFSILGVVAWGIYIEFHEVFYGAGEAPAPGAINDQAFIRAHLVYAFLFLPILNAFLLACESGNQRCRLFAWAALICAFFGLIGQTIWVVTLNKQPLGIALIIMTASLVAGLAGIWQSTKG